MRYSTLAALAAASTVYAQDQSPPADQAATLSSAASDPAAAPPPSNPSQSSLAATPSQPIASGVPPTAPGSSGAGLAGLFQHLTPQCQQGVMSLLAGGGAECLHPAVLMQALGGGKLPAMGSPRPGASRPAPVPGSAATSSVVPASSVAPASSAPPVRRQEAVTSAFGGASIRASSAANHGASAAHSAASVAGPAASAGPHPSVGNENSIIPGVETYLQQACAAPACSNSTITEIAQTVLDSCQVDLQGAGIANSTVQILAQLYPTKREVLCLQTADAPVYDPSAFAPNQQNGTAGGAGASTVVPGPSSAEVPGAASSTKPSPASSELPSASPSPSVVPYKRQEAQGAPPEGAAEPADGSASPSPEDPAASPSVSPAAGNSASPAVATVAGTAPTGPVNGTVPTGPVNGTIPAGNSTANATFCAISLLKGLEEWHGKNLTAHYVMQLVTNSTERAKLSTYPAANLCNDCVYAAATIVETGAPWLLEMPIADTDFSEWYGATCPAANTSISTNGTLPAGVSLGAEDSTFGFPLTFTNATTGQEETTTPNATVTPIGQSNSTTGDVWPWPSDDNSTAPTGPMNGTGPTVSASPSIAHPTAPANATVALPTASAEASVVESPAAETPATESPAAESPAAESPAAESPAAESPAPARRGFRFAREY